MDQFPVKSGFQSLKYQSQELPKCSSDKWTFKKRRNLSDSAKRLGRPKETGTVKPVLDRNDKVRDVGRFGIKVLFGLEAMRPAQPTMLPG